MSAAPYDGRVASPAPLPSHVEVAIVGGGPAGLSAALVLGRARRDVLVIDAGRPGHMVADAVHGFLGQEGVEPAELRRRAWRELAPFAVRRLDDEVVVARRDAGRLALGLAGGATVTCDALVLAGGVGYGLQPVPGLAALWGSRAFHCPFCHGWELRDARVAVLGPAAALDHLRTLLPLFIDALAWFSTGAAGADGPPAVRAVRLDGDDVVVEADGGLRRVDAVLAPPVLAAVDDIPEQLGLARCATVPGLDAAIGLAVDGNGATAVPGVVAAGDLVGDMPSVAAAVGSGARAAVGVVRLLAARRAGAR